MLLFTCSHLPRAITADTNHAPVTNNDSNKNHTYRKSPTTGLLESVQSMGEQMGSLARVEAQNTVAKLEDTKFDLESTLLGLDESTEERKVQLFKKRIALLDQQIVSIKVELRNKRSKST